jgi:cation:H+ antiporter
LGRIFLIVQGMLENVLGFLGGLVLLVVGGRLLVNASVDAARRLSVSPLLVGLTLVAWGTSAPELALNLISTLKGRSDLAMGNIVGANICNLGLVLGVGALIRPLVVERRLIRIELWLCLVVLLGLSVIGLTGQFNRVSAGAMLGVFIVYSVWTVISAKKGSGEASIPDGEGRELDRMPGENEVPMGWTMIVMSFIGGLVLLSIGGSLASDGASGIAIALGVPAAVVGVTIVSIGTTLPELMTTILALRRGQTDLAMGNAIGSCLFNAGAIYGIAGLIDPPVGGGALAAPLVTMSILAILLVPISRTFDRTVSRLEGGILLTVFVAFLIYSGISVR